MAGRGGRGRRRRGPTAAAAAAAVVAAGGAEPGPPAAACECPRMNRFCPQCGRGVEPAFKFCPGCGEKLPPPLPPPPSGEEVPAPAARAAAAAAAAAAAPPSPAQRRPARSPAGGGRARSGSWSPRKARAAAVAPLPENQVLTDHSKKQWRLVKLLEQSGCGLMYEAQSASGTCPQKQRYSLKLDVKDGKIYNEQNFFQRAAKKTTVEKWKKLHSVPLLGIPDCLGFGLHGDNYRFLVFPDLGRTLQSILDDGLNLLREKAAFQIAVRLLDCLEYIHENEYVHGDITAENIYVNPADLTEVTLAGYCFAFRYCPGGKHVAEREGSRTPHEGTIEFISLDSHRGAGIYMHLENSSSLSRFLLPLPGPLVGDLPGPSRRSDLESLGYCLLKWLCGFLPWSDELTKIETVVEKKERYKGDVTGLLRLCFRQKLIPDALQSYLQQITALEYQEKPDYEALRQLLKKPLEKMRASAYDSVDVKVVP